MGKEVLLGDIPAGTPFGVPFSCLIKDPFLPWLKRNTQPMSRRAIAIAAALSVLALGSPLIIANANPLADNLFNSGVGKY